MRFAFLAILICLIAGAHVVAAADVDQAATQVHADATAQSQPQIADQADEASEDAGGEAALVHLPAEVRSLLMWSLFKLLIADALIGPEDGWAYRVTPWVVHPIVARITQPIYEAIEQEFFMYVYFASIPPGPTFKDAGFVLEDLRGMTADEAIAKFGTPYYDSREYGDRDMNNFHIEWQLPGGVFGQFPNLVFENGRVVDLYERDK